MTAQQKTPKSRQVTNENTEDSCKTKIESPETQAQAESGDVRTIKHETTTMNPHGLKKVVLRYYHLQLAAKSQTANVYRCRMHLFGTSFQKDRLCINCDSFPQNFKQQPPSQLHC